MIDYSDDELNSRIEGMLAPDCHPTHFNLTADFDKIIGKSNAEKETLNLPRYYASELIGIKPGENPPYDVLDKSKNEMNETEKALFSDFAMKIARLISADDICDVQGIEFLTKFLAHYNTDQGLNVQNKGYALGVLSLKAKIVGFAKEAIKLGA